MKYLTLFLSFISISLYTQSQIQFPSITLINSIEYNDTSFIDNQPGCGFLLDIGNEILAVTCKHAIWENKPSHLETIDVNSNLQEWKMYIKNDKSQHIVLDKLINNNQNEKIGEWNTDKDFLVFTIKENHSNIKPLKLASKRAEQDDTIFKVGWAFKDNNVPQQLYKSKVYRYDGPSILIQDLPFSNQAGTSGSPVINSNMELLGIVSTWKYDSETSAWYGAPCNTDYLIEVLYIYWLEKNNTSLTYKSFNEFLIDYQSNTNSSFDISTNLITSIFFNNYLKEKNLITSQINAFNDFKAEVKSELDITLEDDTYTLNQLHFNNWKNEFLIDHKKINELLKENLNFNYDFMMLSLFALDLLNQNKNDLALEVMTFTTEQFPNNGQVYAFLGDIYLANGDKANAKLNYEKCLKFYPGYPYAKDKLKKL